MATVEIRCTGADTLPLSSLTHLQGNLKSLSKDAFQKLKASILRSGFLFPFFVWKDGDKNYYLDGHQRDRVLKALEKEPGVELPEKYPVVYVDAKDKKEAAEIILLQSSRYGRMSDESVASFFIEHALDLEALTPILDLPDIAPLDMPDLAEGLTDADEVPEAPVDPITKPGDIWQLGDHRLMCGDSSDKDALGWLMGATKADCIFTDPPYGVAIGDKNRLLNTVDKGERNNDDIQSDAKSPEELKAILLPIFEVMREQVMADDCTLFVTAPQGGDLGMMMMMMMMKEAGLQTRHVLIWKKNNATFSMGRLDYDYAHEPILLTWGKRHKRPMKGEHRTSVWEIDKPRASPEHPTMKPVELYVNAYLNNSDPGDNVFDAFAGSGPMFIAAEQTGRKAFGMEIEPKYCDVIIKRWEQFTGKKAELLPRPVEAVNA